MKSKFIFAFLSFSLLSCLVQARELSSFITDGKDSVTYTADSNKIEVDPNSGLVKATVQTTFGKPYQHAQFLIKSYVAKVTLDCTHYSGSFENIDAYEGDPSTTKKAGTLVNPEPFRDGNGRGFLNKDIFNKVCQAALPQSQQTPIANKKLSPESSSSSTNYCFTSVKNLASCDEQALIATNAHLGSFSKFINNKTAIQTIVLNPKPLDLSFFKPGSPAYEQALENQRNFVPTETYTTKFKVSGNKFEQQVGPNSSCYYQGNFKENKEMIELDSTKLVGNCTDSEQKIGKLALGKVTYKKISF